MTAPRAQLQPGIVRIGHMIDLAHAHAGRFKAVADRVERQLPHRERHRPLAMLDPGKAFLLGGSQHDPVPDQTGRTVVKGSIDAEGEHDDSCRADLLPTYPASSA